MPAFGAVAVDEFDELCSGGQLPEGLGQSPLEDLCGDGRRAGPLDGRDDVFQLAQIPLPHASAAVVDASPLRVVRMAFDAFGFQASPISPSLVTRSTVLGDTNGDFKRKLLGKTEEKVRGYRSVALNRYSRQWLCILRDDESELGLTVSFAADSISLGHKQRPGPRPHRVPTAR